MTKQAQRTDPETIKMTNGEIEARLGNPAFAKAVKRNFPVKTSYWLGRCLKKMEEEFRHHSEKINELVENLAEKEIDGKTGNPRVKRRPDGQPVWGKSQEKAEVELKELREIEVDLGFQKICLDLEACEKRGLEVSPEDFALLIPFFEEVKQD